MTKTIELRCRQAGQLVIEGQTSCGDREGNCDCGALAHYHVQSAEKLYEIAAAYDWIHRPNGKTERGRTYTQNKARNDFRALTA